MLYPSLDSKLPLKEKKLQTEKNNQPLRTFFKILQNLKILVQFLETYNHPKDERGSEKCLISNYLDETSILSSVSCKNRKEIQYNK